QINPPYLIYSLAQAKELNPGSDIFLLGDNINKYLRFIHHEDFNLYCEGAKEFEKIYTDKHMSSNDLLFEMFCFQRWFILRDFMRKNQIKKCVHIDSDILLYANISEEQEKFDHSDFTVSRKGSGHNSFIKLEGIEEFCQFLIDFYTKPSLFKILESLWEEKKSRPGGICDMTLLNQYYQRNTDKIAQTSDIINDSVYDGNINASHGFEMHNGIKNIFWVDGKPFCRHLDSGKDIKFNSLHFQGKAKRLMKDYCTANKTLVSYYMIERKGRRVLSKIKNQFSIVNK
ncbi:MAG: hypothetical protein AAFW70_27005, partial [Cyanobacteria bacterium J06635_10]